MLNSQRKCDSLIKLAKMRRQRLGVTIPLLLWTLGLVQATNYEFVIDNEEIFTPCEDYLDNYIDGFFDLSKIAFIREEDLIHVQGPVVVTKLFKDLPIQLDGQVFRKERGEWVDTLYNMRRSDLCPVLYDSNEIWYKFTSLVPEDQRSCPPPQNLTIDFDTMCGLSYDLPDRNAEGDYKIQMKLAQGPDLMCFEIYASVFKA